jgi:glycogen debranching enzyme
MGQPGASVVQRRPDVSYEVPDDHMLVGASLGNTSAWIVGKATGAIQKMYSLTLAEDVFWSLVVTYGSARRHVLVGLEFLPGAAKEHFGQEHGYVILSPVRPGVFQFHCCYQRHIFELPSNLVITETIFVPRTGLEDPAIAYFVIDVRNEGSEKFELAVHGYAKLAGTTPKDIVAAYDPQLRAFVGANQSHPDWVRIFGCSIPPHTYQTVRHAAESYDPLNVPPLTNDTSITGDVIAALGTIVSVPPGATRRLVFYELFCEKGEAAARQIYAAAADAEAALRRTIDHYGSKLSVAQVITPEKLINDGSYWAKVNMLRVLARYPRGIGFTNNPGSSPNIVGRDLAWFALGCNFLDPQFSASMLLRYAGTQYENGKMPEYYNAVTGQVDDYGLNINDDTPLFILACGHHHYVANDERFLREVWPAVARAADYILTQRDERGLVVCTARGENVYGIAGWRNVVPHLTINGAVTEINSECYAALAMTGRMAGAMAKLHKGKGDFEVEAERYSKAANALRDAVNEHLLNPRNGMYLLNIDLDGHEHADVTGDEVFPVMFAVAPPAVAYRIISRLNTSDFQTEAGLRTVSRLSPDYTPYRDVGLIGGVWPGLSFWYAFAAAKLYPDAMAHNLKQTYSHFLRDPKIYNTVPGQFSEWFDGESLINRGMRLSPWEPPRYLWAAIEGACGLTIGEGVLEDPTQRPSGKEASRFRVAPLMPSGWRWLGVRRVPLGGRYYSYFAMRDGQKFHVFADGHLGVDGELEVFDEDVTDRIDRLDPDMEVIAFHRRDEWLVCVGSTLEAAYTFPLSLGRLLDDQRRYQAHIYNATVSRWIEGEHAPGREFRDIALRIEGQSFALARIIPA